MKTIDVVIKNNISLYDYYFLKLLYDNDNKQFNKYYPYFSTKIIIENLVNAKFLLINNEKNISLKSFTLLQKSLSLLGGIKDVNVEEWITEYINIFPEGIKSGNLYVRADKISCIDHMTKFIKKYKYTKKQIIEATKRYVDRKSKENYEYMKTAVNFISKNGVSILASEIENLNAKENVITISLFEKELK